MRELADELSRRLRSAGLRGRTIGIKVRLDDWTNVTRARTRRGADQRRGADRPRSRVELLRAYSPPRPVRLLGVRVAAFGDGEPAGDGATRSEPAAPQPRRLAGSGLPARQQDADVREAEALLGRRGQVVVAAGRRRGRGRSPAP